MNELDGLRPDDTALRLFFARDTLYADGENDPEPSTEEQSVNQEKSNQNPATLSFEGSFSADFLMIFRHSEKTVLFGEWGEMVSRLIENPQALNRSKNEVVLVNLENNPTFSLQEVIAGFPAKKVVLWGASCEEKDVYSFWEEDGKACLKVEGPEFYQAQPKSRMDLLTQIKTKLP